MKDLEMEAKDKNYFWITPYLALSCPVPISSTLAPVYLGPQSDAHRILAGPWMLTFLLHFLGGI
jgi:hypothetical protein